MTEYRPSRSGTLLVPSGPDGMHLFVIMTKACKDDQHLLLPITSVKPGKYHDPTCLFDGGEHPFIARASFAAYKHCELRKSAHIMKCVTSGFFIPKVSLKPELVQKLGDGVAISPFSKPWVIRQYQENCN